MASTKFYPCSDMKECYNLIEELEGE